MAPRSKGSKTINMLELQREFHQGCSTLPSAPRPEEERAAQKEEKWGNRGSGGGGGRWADRDDESDVDEWRRKEAPGGGEAAGEEENISNWRNGGNKGGKGDGKKVEEEEVDFGMVRNRGPAPAQKDPDDIDFSDVRRKPKIDTADQRRTSVEVDFSDVRSKQPDTPPQGDSPSDPWRRRSARGGGAGAQKDVDDVDFGDVRRRDKKPDEDVDFKRVEKVDTRPQHLRLKERIKRAGSSATDAAVNSSTSAPSAETSCATDARGDVLASASAASAEKRSPAARSPLSNSRAAALAEDSPSSSLVASSPPKVEIGKTSTAVSTVASTNKKTSPTNSEDSSDLSRADTEVAKMKSSGLTAPAPTTTSSTDAPSPRTSPVSAKREVSATNSVSASEGGSGSDKDAKLNKTVEKILPKNVHADDVSAAPITGEKSVGRGGKKRREEKETKGEEEKEKKREEEEGKKGEEEKEKKREEEKEKKGEDEKERSGEDEKEKKGWASSVVLRRLAEKKKMREKEEKIKASTSDQIELKPVVLGSLKKVQPSSPSSKAPPNPAQSATARGTANEKRHKIKGENKSAVETLFGNKSKAVSSRAAARAAAAEELAERKKRETEAERKRKIEEEKMIAEKKRIDHLKRAFACSNDEYMSKFVNTVKEFMNGNNKDESGSNTTIVLEPTSEEKTFAERCIRMIPEEDKGSIAPLLCCLGLSFSFLSASPEDPHSTLKPLAELMRQLRKQSEVVENADTMVVYEVVKMARRLKCPRLSSDTAAVEAVFDFLEQQKIIPRETFIAWLDDLDDETPGRMEVMFQLTQWSLFIRGEYESRYAEDEESEDNDDDIEALVPKRVVVKLKRR